ncbi:MAG: UPF0758 domain-containing protein [Bacteroidota bacterium]
MKKNCIASETFGNPGMNYFVDFMEARNHTDYIQITRSDLQQDGTYLRNSVRIFEENFMMLFEALSMVITDVGHHRRPNSGKSEQYCAANAVQGIKSWSPEQRPREKLLSQGREAVTDAELLAMLIGSGTGGQTAVDLATKILQAADGNLAELGRFDVEKLCSFKGIGPAKALSIIAALELSERRFSYRHRYQSPSVLV